LTQAENFLKSETNWMKSNIKFKDKQTSLFKHIKFGEPFPKNKNESENKRELKEWIIDNNKLPIQYRSPLFEGFMEKYYKEDS